jgi:hypothetical protein
MTAEVVAAPLGAAGGVISSLGVSFTTRRRTAAEADKAEATKAKAEAERAIQEGAKLAAEADEIHARLTRTATEAEELRAENEQIRSRVANAEASIAYERADPRLLTVYDSTRNGFSLFDFTMVTYDEAQGELKVFKTDTPDDTLLLLRPTTAGKVYIWLATYDYAGAPGVIPVGNAAGVRRKLRVQCEARALSAAHTFLLVLKAVNAPAGEYLDVRRERIETEQWVPIDVVFSVAVATDFRLRIEDRSVSAAPSRLEIRNLKVTERDAPASLRPADQHEPGPGTSTEGTGHG